MILFKFLPNIRRWHFQLPVWTTAAQQTRTLQYVSLNLKSRWIQFWHFTISFGTFYRFRARVSQFLWIKRMTVYVASVTSQNGDASNLNGRYRWNLIKGMGTWHRASIWVFWGLQKWGRDNMSGRRILKCENIKRRNLWKWQNVSIFNTILF